MSQTATIFNSMGSRNQLRSSSRMINYVPDIRVTIQDRFQPIAKAVPAPTPKIPQPVITAPSEFADQFIDENIIVEEPTVEVVAVEAAPLPTYSNLTAEEKAAMLQRAIENYSLAEAALNEPIALTKIEQFKNIINSSYKTVTLVASKVVPAISQNIKKIRVMTPAEAKESQQQTIEAPTLEESKITASEIIQTASSAAARPATVRSKGSRQTVITVVSVLALLLVTVACVDTWLTNRNINRDIDTRISTSTISQSQPSQ